MGLRIAFCGLPLAALLLAADGHTIVWAGICRREALGTRRLTRVLGASNVVVVPNLARSIEAVAKTKPDLIVSWFWTKNIPRAFRALGKHGAIGVHPSLLPRHRGPDPYFWAIERGDTETGVSAHVLDDEYDTGAVLGMRALAIDPGWNAWTLAKKLDRPSLALLRETVAAFARGMPPPPMAQDEAKATPAPSPEDDLLELRFHESSAAIVRRVRAAAPWPGAFTSIGDETIVLTKVEARGLTEANGRAVLNALEPGEAAVIDGVALVRTGDGAVALLEGRHEEDERTLDVAALAALVRDRSAT